MGSHAILRRLSLIGILSALTLVTACETGPAPLRPDPYLIREWDEADLEVRVSADPTDVASHFELLRMVTARGAWGPTADHARARRRALAFWVIDYAPDREDAGLWTRFEPTGSMVDPEGATEAHRRWMALAQSTTDARVFKNAIAFFQLTDPAAAEAAIARAESVAPSPEWSEQRGRLYALQIAGRGPDDAGQYGDGVTVERRAAPLALEARAKVAASTDPILLWAAANELLGWQVHVDAELKPVLVGLVDRVAVMMPGDLKCRQLQAAFHEYLYAGLRAELLALGHQSREALQMRLEALQPEERVDTMAAMAEMTLRRRMLSHGAMDPIAGELALAALMQASRLHSSPILSAAVLRAHAIVGLAALQAGDRAAALDHLTRASALWPAEALASGRVLEAYDELWYALLDAGERESVAVALDEIGAMSRAAGLPRRYERYARDIRAGQMPALYQISRWSRFRNTVMMARAERAKQEAATRRRAHPGG